MFFQHSLNQRVLFFTGGLTMEKIRMTDSTLGFIGLGLIGGSIARGIKRARPDIKIMAYMRSRNRLEQAKKRRRGGRDTGWD